MLIAPQNSLTYTEGRIVEFLGINRRLGTSKYAGSADGEMPEMRNLTSDKYPFISPRKGREEISLPDGVITPLSVIAKYDKLAMIARTSDGTRFFYDGVLVPEVNNLSENTTMVSINTRIVFFPEKTCYHLVEHTYTSLEASKSNSYGAMQVRHTDESDELYIGDASSFSADDAIDITGELHYEYLVDQSGTEMDLSNTYFTWADGIATETVPTADTWNGGSEWYVFETGTSNVTISTIIKDIDYNAAMLTLPQNTFIEMQAGGADTAQLKNARVYRECPDLDFVMEYNNRLWGVSNSDNTIYASKLGDPKNWKYYQTTSMDSFYAEQGTDGEWTGLAPYASHLLFFKENSIAKVYGTTPSTFQITNAVAPGIEKGSEKSAVTISDTVIYKSPVGIMAYQGGTPYQLDVKLGTAKSRNAVAGSDGRKYYISLDYGTGESHDYRLMALDMDMVRNDQVVMWHEEDDFRARDIVTLQGELYAIKDDGTLWKLGSDNPTEGPISWMAVFGEFDEYMENKKIYSKLSLRVTASEGASLSVYIKMDAGEWELVKTYENMSKGGEFIPVVPRRCDRYSVKLEGTGYMEIKEITRRMRLGTGGKL